MGDQIELILSRIIARNLVNQERMLAVHIEEGQIFPCIERKINWQHSEESGRILQNLRTHREG